jgi:Family of unknown function (DUF6339)
VSRITGAAALTDSALIALNDALDEAAFPTDFLAQADAIIEKSENRLVFSTDLGEPDPIRPATGAAGVDAANGPTVFEYVGALDPSNASDPRLWTFMAFSTYRSYMEERWPLFGASNWKNRARDRWLLRGTTRGRLVRHGIARLWWVANLTYDAKCEYPLSKANDDPFAYTRAVFRNEDRINALFDREAGAISSVVRAALEHVGKNATYERDKHMRALMKELTLVMGFRDLGVLGATELDELIEEVRPHYESDGDDADGPAAGAA